MPYVFNRYLVALVVMGVLLAVFFVLLVYVVVFPFQAREEARLEAERARVEAVTARDAAYQSLDSILGLIGGGPDAAGDVDRSDARVIERAWSRHIEKGVILPERYNTIADYVKALEGRCEDLRAEINTHKDEIKKCVDANRDIGSRVSDLFVIACGDDVPKPEEMMEQIRRISEEIRNLRPKLTEAIKDRDRCIEKRNDLQKELDELKRTHKNEIDRLNAAVTAIRKERDKFKEKAAGLETKVIDLQEQVRGKEEKGKTRNVLVVEERFEATPDGEVIMTRRSGQTVFGAVDIGKAQKARPGMIFEVFRGETTKGRIQLYRVDENTSCFRLLELYDEHNPILKGDQIHSPFYRRGVPAEFVVLGEFPPPLSRAKVIDRIEQWGGTVGEKIGATTKYVVIGKGILTEEVRTAIQLYNVETIAMAGLRDFLGEE
ncbi:MAG: hypothetical protein DRP79_04610 [Planctomycetota bacterium]|nr:MAG: hypothetical protein DRP79_04610 [Planctomycetota bacterium]